MQGVLLLPTKQRDILWLDAQFAMNHTTWDHVLNTWSNPSTRIFDNLGGVFTSPPVAVSPIGGRLDAFGLGRNYAVYHKTYDAATTTWSPDWENLGGNCMSTPAVVSAATNRMDIFALGIDQGMVHKSWTGAAWADWDELGDSFTSPPVVLPSGDGKFHVFARGLDYLVYHLTYDPASLGDWSVLGGGLLGQPIASSVPAAIAVADRMYVFAVGPDGAMWGTIFDGRVWKPWFSLGPAQAASSDGSVPAIGFASEPVLTISFPSPVVGTDGPPKHSQTSPSPRDPSDAPQSYGRLDIFAVATDGALWHNWLDQAGWQTAWQPLGGSLACAPLIVVPPVTLVEAPQPLGFDMIQPQAETLMAVLRTFDGTSTTYPAQSGPTFALPNAFSFGVSDVDVLSLRSNGSLGEKDTDHATATLTVGKWPLQAKNFLIGDVGTGPVPLYNNLTFNQVLIELCEPVVLCYVIINAGHSGTEGLIATAVAKGVEDWVNDIFKAKLNPSQNVIALGLDTGLLADAGGGPILIGSLLGAAVATGLDLALSAIFADCDGLVASGMVAYLNGRALQQQVLASQPEILGSINSPGTDSNAGCGSNSNYTVSHWIQGE